MSKKILCATLAALLLTLSCLTSCSADTSAPVMVYEDTEVTEAMYTYWLSNYKGYFLSLLGGTDTEAFLNTTMALPNETGTDVEVKIADYLSARIEEIIENNIISLYLFDYYDLELPASTVSSVNQRVESAIADAGGRRAFNEILAKISLTEKTLRQMYLYDEKISYVYDYLYGNTTLGTQGAEPISVDRYNAFYEENYVCVRHIYIRTADKNVLDDEGNVMYDTDGNVITEELTEAEAKEKLALCDSIMSSLADGADFASLEKEHSQDSGRETFVDGYIISHSSSLPDAFIDAAFDMEVGEIRRVDASYATHIMLKTELPEGGWQNTAYEALMGDFKEYVKSEVYAEKIAPMIEEISRDDEIIAKHDIYNTPVTSY